MIMVRSLFVKRFSYRYMWLFLAMRNLIKRQRKYIGLKDRVKMPAKSFSYKGLGKNEKMREEKNEQ